MAPNSKSVTLIVEDDTADAVKFACIGTAAAFKGDVVWVSDLTKLEEYISKNGPPTRLILDNNLPGGRGIPWLKEALIKGLITRDTIIAAISSTNISDVLGNFRELNILGAGAFPKAHIAELLLWMATKENDMRNNTHLCDFQRYIYDVEEADKTFMTEFGMAFDGTVTKIPLLSKLHPMNCMNCQTWNYQSGQTIFTEDQTFGLFQQLVCNENLAPKEIMSLTRDDFLRRILPSSQEGQLPPAAIK